jgi:glycosyltransferase involved in cell wall biosynthesis
MMGKPGSFFAKKWLNTYKNFRSKGRDEYWDEHSVIIPYCLSKKYSDHIVILDKTKFFYPLWNEIKDCLFNNDLNNQDYTNICKNSYSIHLWETFTKEELTRIDETNIFTENTWYNILARKFLRSTISITMLTYNRLEKTKECLWSYLKCLDEDYIEELLILDNASEPATVDMLYHFQLQHPKIRIIRSKENLGVGPGRNILFRQAKGNIIASLDSDAYLVSNSFFEKVADILYNESIGMVGVSGAFIYSWKFGTHKDTNNDDEYEYEVDVLAGCCQCFRRDIQYTGFSVDPNFGKFWCEDTDLCYQIATVGKKIYRIKQKGYLLHEWGGSGNAAEFKGLFEKNWNYLKQKWLEKIEIRLNKETYIQPQPCNDVKPQPQNNIRIANTAPIRKRENDKIGNPQLDDSIQEIKHPVFSRIPMFTGI